MPIFIAANAVPIIAFAPIFNAWFNPISPNSKIAVAAVLCFLPVMVNTLRGLQSASPRQIELMRSYAASELEIWRRVRIPTALPFLFTALKVASVLAMIGAIVGEYFGGALNALGVLINSEASDLPLRDRVGGDPRRVGARHRALRRRRLDRAARHPLVAADARLVIDGAGRGKNRQASSVGARTKGERNEEAVGDGALLASGGRARTRRRARRRRRTASARS